jgi:hypothetical protein
MMPVTSGTAFQAALTGASEVPPVTTNTSGMFAINVNSAANTATFDLNVRNGIAITQSHLHCARPGVNGPVIAFLAGPFLPNGLNVNGELARSALTNASILPAGATCEFPVTNLASLKIAIERGIIYANVHSVANPAGEIRGLVVPTNTDTHNNMMGNDHMQMIQHEHDDDDDDNDEDDDRDHGDHNNRGHGNGEHHDGRDGHGTDD